MEQMISYQNLKVAPYTIERLLDVRIDHRINEHSTLYLKALLPEDKKDSYVKDGGQGGSVKLSVSDTQGGEEVLFLGMVQNVEVSAVLGSYYMEVYGISHSYELDVEKKSRSFQDKNMTYEKLIRQVAGEYGDAGVKDAASGGAQTGQLIVQYEETDWEFLKRLASHFHTGLVNDTQFDSPRFYFGVPDNGSLGLEAFNYSVKQDVGRYLKLSKNGVPGLKRQDFLFYEVETYLPAQIGDKIQFNGQTLHVCQVKGRMERGIFLYHLTLSAKKGMSQPYLQHEKIAGCSLDAKITEIKNDQVKVSIKIDEAIGHSPGEPCFFPYSTIYSSKDGSGWYCMPEMGDHVRIYFPDGKEDHSYAISSVHEAVDGKDSGKGTSGPGQGTKGPGGSYSGGRDDPSVKSLRNKDGKEIRLAPEGIYIIADGTVITLTDDGGVSIASDQDIKFKSDKNILISAREDISVMGQNGVELSAGETSSIKMSDNIEVIGQEVKSN